MVFMPFNKKDYFNKVNISLVNRMAYKANQLEEVLEWHNYST